MTDEEILGVLRSRLQGFNPSLGHVYTTLLVDFKPEEIATQTHFEDPDLGRIMRFWIIRPDEGREDPHTTGRLGFSQALQEYQITGFISVAKQGAPENKLNADAKRIRDSLRTLTRFKAGADKQETVNLRTFRWSGISRVGVGETLCHVKSINLTVQQRIQAI